MIGNILSLTNFSSAREYLRGYTDPHKGLSLLKAAVRMNKNITVLRVPMHVPSNSLLGHGKLASLAYKFLAHVFLINRIRKLYSVPKIVIREFLTIPLLLLSPFFWVYRNKLWFLCQHNIAYCAKKPLHRFALKFMHYFGFRFLMYENLDAWELISKKGSEDSLRAILLPMPDWVDMRGEPKNNNEVVIGFVGNFRSEKSPLWAIDVLFREFGKGGSLSDCKLVIGTNSIGLLERYKDLAEIRDTTSYLEYRNTLRRCDIVVLPYDFELYSFRTSGVLAEAVASGCVVVIPDLPVLRNQVQEPAQVGVTYSSPNELLGSIHGAIKLVRNESSINSIQLHKLRRGKAAIVEVLNTL